MTQKKQWLKLRSYLLENTTFLVVYNQFGLTHTSFSRWIRWRYCVCVLWREENKFRDTSIARFDDKGFVGGERGGLGILLIIIDDLPHEAIWRLWLEEKEEKEEEEEKLEKQANNDSRDLHLPLSSSSPSLLPLPPSPPPRLPRPRCRVWIHAKHPERVTSAWVRRRLVTSFQLCPSWGSLDLARVMLLMLREVRETVNTAYSTLQLPHCSILQIPHSSVLFCSVLHFIACHPHVTSFLPLFLHSLLLCFSHVMMLFFCFFLLCFAAWLLLIGAGIGWEGEGGGGGRVFQVCVCLGVVCARGAPRCGLARDEQRHARQR